MKLRDRDGQAISRQMHPVASERHERDLLDGGKKPGKACRKFAGLCRMEAHPGIEGQDLPGLRHDQKVDLLSLEEIVRLKSEGETTGITGAEAVQKLGLSTQVILKEVFLTSGRSRKIQLENGREIVLRHVAPRKLVLAGRTAGVALTALWYLGKKGVSTETIRQIRRRLPSEEFEVLKKRPI